MYRHPLVDINNINVPHKGFVHTFLCRYLGQIEIVTNKLQLIFFFINMLLLYFNVQYTNAYFTDLYLKSKRQHFRVFVYKSNIYFFFHMKLQNFDFKNYLNHYLKRSDHFHGTLKFLHTVSVSSSDSLVIGFRCMFINEINC